MAPGFGKLEQNEAERLISAALCEDLGDFGDLTTQAMSLDQEAAIEIVSREAGVIAGLPIAQMALHQVDADAKWESVCVDGSNVSAGQVVAKVSGRLASLLTAERTCLNFLTHLSGIASLTHQFVQAVDGTKCAILDTRKTIPGWRYLQKYSVRAGGGTNHRIGLFDGILIKDNHIAGWQSNAENKLAGAVTVARERFPHVAIQIEVDSLEQLNDVLPAKPDMVLLDNMSCEQLVKAVAMRDAANVEVELEASGNVNLSTVTMIAATGVDRISIGALTHSAAALDIGFDFS